MDSLRDSLREITKPPLIHESQVLGGLVTSSRLPSLIGETEKSESEETWKHKNITGAPKNKEQTKCHTTDTPLKSNMEPKHGGLKDDVPFQLDDFEVPC